MLETPVSLSALESLRFFFAGSDDGAEILSEAIGKKSETPIRAALTRSSSKSSLVAMQATPVRLSKASRAPLTPKRGNKDYYKGGLAVLGDKHAFNSFMV